MSNPEPRTPAPPIVPPAGPPATPPPPAGTGVDSGDGGTKERGKQAADTAKDEGRHVAEEAANQGAQVAATAAEGAKDVVQEAKQEAADVARTASDEARRMFGEASSEFRTQADSQTDRLAEGLRSLSGQLLAAGSGKPLDEGPIRDIAEEAGAKVDRIAQRLSSGGVDGLVDDVTSFARRRPGTFLAGAATAGFLAGRLLRGAQAASQDQPSGSSRPRTTAPVPPVQPGLTTPPPAVPPVTPAPTGVVVIDEGPTGAPTPPPAAPTTPPGVIPPATGDPRGLS